MHGFQPGSPQLYINPLYLQAASQRSRQVFDPVTWQPIGLIPLCDQSDIQVVVEKANLAHHLWSLLEGERQRALLHQVADGIESACELNAEIARLMTLESALSLTDASCELAACPGIFRYYAELAADLPNASDACTPGSSPCQVRHEPHGVSVHILPFSPGLILLCRTLAAALASGNSCIVKPAEQATLSTLAFMQHFACLPTGLVSCIPGNAATGQWLLQSNGTHAVAFTGSVAAGSAVAVTCAELLKPCLIEIGGRGSMIISRQAPLELAARGSAAAAFARNGQSCLSIQHFFVEQRVHDQFVEHFLEQTRALGPLGPLISAAAQHKVRRLVNDALAKGARQISGGHWAPASAGDESRQPIILTDIDDSMAISQEECLGPVAVIRRVSDLSDAVQQINDGPLGQWVALFSSDPDETRLACERLKVGQVRVNPLFATDDPGALDAEEMSRLASESGARRLDGFRRAKRVVFNPHASEHQAHSQTCRGAATWAR